MRQPKHIRFFIRAMLIALLFVLLVSSLLYGWYIHLYDDSKPPLLSRIILPLLVGIAASIPFVTYLYNKVNFKLVFIATDQRITHQIATSILLIGTAVGLFQPLSVSIRYNFGKVLHLQSVDDMPAHEHPTFLSLGEWHVDRMRVIPIQTYETGKWWNSDKVYLKSLFLLPIFSKRTAYQNDAKAWLAFKYEHTISEKEFSKNQGQTYFDQSLRHFKRINVGAFLYFELYEAGEEKQLLTLLARNHSYFKSSYSAIYQGNSVDRDLISQRYFVYTLFGLFLLIIPLYWAAARFLFSIAEDEDVDVA